MGRRSSSLRGVIAVALLVSLLGASAHKVQVRTSTGSPPRALTTASDEPRTYGYWAVGTDGGVFAYGGAPFLGSATGVSKAPVVGLSPTATGTGYWLVALDGGVFAYGDAQFAGSAAGLSHSSVVALAPTPSGKGYWLAGLDGGVFSFGDAPFLGSAVGSTSAPITGVVATATGRGYWAVALDGGVFAFGDAGFAGSAAAMRPAPVVALAPTVTGRGYWLAAADGGVFAFGDAPFLGSLSGSDGPPIVGMTPSPSGMGYWLVARDGSVHAFGDALFAGTPAGVATTPVLGLARPGGPPTSGGGLVAQGAPGIPTVALTFDDGPDSVHTPAVLDALARLGVPATFFDLGVHAAQYPDLVRAEARQGHSVQNHTWAHRPLATLSGAAFGAQVDQTETVIGSLTGVAPRCVRPPGGQRNAATDARLAVRGLADAGWNVDPQDWRGSSAREITNRVLSQLHPVSVVVLHDRTNSAEALPALVSQLRIRGFRFATICQTSATLPGSRGF